MNPNKSTKHDVVTWDKAYVWHPFTPMGGWCDPAFEPVVLESAQGVWLTDIDGRRYIDGNASIWTNLHGHNHPAINAAVRDQLGRVAHCSFLGFTHAPGARLAKELVAVAPGPALTRVFFSDDGSTANEAAIRMAVQFRALRGERERDTLIAFAGAYHGDTLGAASASGIDAFKGALDGLGYRVVRAGSVDELDALGPELARRANAAIIEPLVRGPAAMRPWPDGMLRQLRDWCDRTGTLLVLDEVMTGFGRTGTMFACEQEGVVPDFLCLAKGITGGYLPLAATLTTDAVFETFLGGPDRAFYYGHSYTANPLACAAALASLDVFRVEDTLTNLQPKIAQLRDELAETARLPAVKEVRQRGFVAAVELHGPPGGAAGPRACAAARHHGLLTRPIGNSVILVFPLCITRDELAIAMRALRAAIADVPAGG